MGYNSKKIGLPIIWFTLFLIIAEKFFCFAFV